MRKCDRCRATMAAGRPRVRVGGKQLWCQTCAKTKDAPSGAYKPGSDIAKAAMDASEWLPTPEEHAARDRAQRAPILPGQPHELARHLTEAHDHSLPASITNDPHFGLDTPRGRVLHDVLTQRHNDSHAHDESAFAEDRLFPTHRTDFGMHVHESRKVAHTDPDPDLPSGTGEEFASHLPHLHHMVTEHGVSPHHVIQLLHAGGHIMPTTSSNPDLENYAQVIRGTMAIHKDMHNGGHGGVGVGHSHSPTDPLTTSEFRPPYPEQVDHERGDRSPIADSPLRGFQQQKNFNRDLDPDRPEHLPNKRVGEEPHPNTLSGCPHVYDSETQQAAREEANKSHDASKETGKYVRPHPSAICDHCGVYKDMHAEFPPSQEGKAHPWVYQDRGKSFTRSEKAPFTPLPHSLNSRKIAVEDFVSRAQDDHAALQARYRGQHGVVTRGPDGEPVYEISHPSGYLGRIGHGPYMAISHQATPDRTYDTQSVGAMTESGHMLHPSMATDDPLVNHHRAMWHLDNWVKTWGETHSQTTPAIKNWKGRRGLASKASTESKEPGFMKKVALTNIRTGQRIIVVAHDSGDGQTIYHCPFCGSGQVIARSDGTIECEFCHTMFTVQVQPEYNAFPQTINGQPVQVPGMPGQIDDPTDPMAGADPNDPTMTDADQDGEADATDGDTDGDGVSDNFAGPASADNQPPWLKGAVLRTSTGTYLNPDDFVAHLAIKHADDRSAAIQQVRATRRSQ